MELSEESGGVGKAYEEASVRAQSKRPGNRHPTHTPGVPANPYGAAILRGILNLTSTLDCYGGDDCTGAGHGPRPRDPEGNDRGLRTTDTPTHLTQRSGVVVFKHGFRG